MWQKKKKIGKEKEKETNAEKRETEEKEIAGDTEA